MDCSRREADAASRSRGDNVGDRMVVVVVVVVVSGAAPAVEVSHGRVDLGEVVLRITVVDTLSPATPVSFAT